MKIKSNREDQLKLHFLNLCSTRNKAPVKILDVLNTEGIDLSSPEEESSKSILIFFDAGKLPLDFKDNVLPLAEKGPRVVLVNCGKDRLPLYEVLDFLETGVEEVLQGLPETEIAISIKGKLQRWKVIDRKLKEVLKSQAVVGNTPLWLKVVRQVIELASFSSVSILLQGETGTGKEVLAQLIHKLDRRPGKQDLVTVDCTTLSPELAASELFGHEKGSFTTALSTRMGAIELANEGALFLDEIGELPRSIQAELLRTIQEGTFKRVGSNQWKKSKFRLISATNRDLSSRIKKGKFRLDLYHRLATSVVRLPPLRERRLDILPLAEFFIRQISHYSQLPVLDRTLRDFLLIRNYPGNVRELKHLIWSMMGKYSGQGPLTIGCIPTTLLNTSYCSGEKSFEYLRRFLRNALAKGSGLSDIKKEVAQVAISLTIAENQGNLQEAARQLKVCDRTVQMAVAKFKCTVDGH